MTGKLRGILGIAAIATAVLAGCGGTAEQGADSITGSDVLNATEAANTAKFAMTMTNSSNSYEMEWTAEGAVDLEHERGTADITMKSESPTSPGTGVDAVEQFPPPGGMSVEARWIGNEAWIRVRKNEDPKTAERWGLPAGKWLATGESDDEYVDCSVAGGAGFGMDGPPTDAALDILDTLRTNGNALEQLGTEVVRDEPTTHWRVASPKLSPKCDAEDLATLEKVVVEVWTDDAERARRILLTIDGKGYSGTDKEHASFSTDFWDFGTEVTVSPPPASEVVAEETFEDESMEHSVTEAANAFDYGTPGEWKVAAEGTRKGNPWRVWTSETSTGAFCSDAENVSDRATAGGAGPDSQVMHDGRVAMCIGGPIRGLVYGDFVVVAAVTDAEQLSLVGRTDGDKVDLTFADGSTQPMQVNSETGIAQWHGPVPQGIVKVDTGSGTCTLGVEFDGEMQPTLDTNEMPCLGDYGNLDDAP